MDNEGSFTQLGRKPLDVDVIGVITGGIILGISPPSLQFTLGPRGEDRHPEISDRIIVSKPGQHESSAANALNQTYEMQRHVRVVGAYTPEPRGDYLGKIVARDVFLLDTCE